MAEYKLIHFNTRFLAEPARFIFAYADVPYEDVRISVEDWPNTRDSIPYKQVPLLVLSDGKTLSQSNAICRYLGDKFNLSGQDEWEAAKCNEYADHYRDMRQEWRKFFFEEDPELKISAKHYYKDKVVARFFEVWERDLEERQSDCLIGDNVTWIDLLHATTVGFFEDSVDPEIMTPYPNLRRVKNKIWGHPKIRGWLQKRPKPNLKILKQIPLAV